MSSFKAFIAICMQCCTFDAIKAWYKCRDWIFALVIKKCYTTLVSFVIVLKVHQSCIPWGYIWAWNFKGYLEVLLLKPKWFRQQWSTVAQVNFRNGQLLLMYQWTLEMGWPMDIWRVPRHKLHSEVFDNETAFLLHPNVKKYWYFIVIKIGTALKNDIYAKHMVLIKCKGILFYIVFGDSN